MTLPLDERRPFERLALIIWTVGLVACCLGGIGAVCWIVVPPIPHDAVFVARFAVLDGFLYPGQPAKTMAFQCCVVTVPFLILMAASIGRKILSGWDVVALRRFVKIGFALHLLFFAACIRPIFYYPHPPLWEPPTWILVPLPFPPPGVPTWTWIASVLFLFAFIFFLIAGFSQPVVRRGVAMLVVFLAVLLAPVEFYAPSQINDLTAFTYHLNAMMDALSQSVDGHHLLVDFPHIYGGYGEMLAPIIRLFPRTMAVPLIVLAIPTLLGIWFWLATAFRIIKNPVLLALATVALIGVTFLAALPPNYCYGTPRTLFPSLVLLLVASYFRRPTTALFWIISMLAAIASVWNLDTGLVLWFAWALTLAVGDVAQRDVTAFALHFAAQVAVLFVTWAAFVIYLTVASHHAIDSSLLFYFQSMVVKSGYFCVGMIVPGAWTFVLLLYITGLALAFFAHQRPHLKWQGRMVLMLSLTGIGMFSYYMGRSAESNLISVCPPGILLAGLLGDRMLARVRRGLLPPVTRWFFVPWGVMIFWWALLLFVHLPILLKQEGLLADEIVQPGPNFVRANADFAAQLVHPGESDVFFLSGHSGFYYYLTGTVRPLRVPGNVELLQMRDMDALIQTIESRQIPKLFVERNFWKMDMYRRDVYDALDTAIRLHYQVVSSSPDGKLVFYQPVADAPVSVTFSLPR